MTAEDKELDRGKITVLILVPNAEDKIARCLESVSWADDIFCVIDTKTSDGSEEIVRRHTDHIAHHTYENAAAQRNWALPQILTEWTLVLDADEWLSESLTDRLKGLVSEDGSLDGYDIKRDSYFFGRLIRHCGWHRDYNLRLFRTAKGRYLDKKVHSRVLVEGTVGRIEDVMFHDTYNTFEEYFTTFQRFTTWGAEDAYQRGKRAGILDLTFRPLLRFVKMYVVRQGFRDGYHGAVLCGLAACSVFTKYAKLWHIGLKETMADKRD
jgi:glycosyltransferase involved in cell wall biosynthesis